MEGILGFPRDVRAFLATICNRGKNTAPRKARLAGRRVRYAARGIQFATKIPGREILCNGAPTKMAAPVQASHACRII
jgi:hypothetical protein